MKRNSSLQSEVIKGDCWLTTFFTIRRNRTFCTYIYDSYWHTCITTLNKYLRSLWNCILFTCICLFNFMLVSVAYIE
jgi:hypothetical protein